MSGRQVRQGARARRAQGLLVLALVGGMILTACGNETTPAATTGGTNGSSPSPAAGDPDNPCPDRDVEAVLAELAAMPYEERLEVMEEKASEEGAVLLYTSSDLDLNEELVAGFEELYPDITFDYIRVQSEAAPLRMQSEARAGRHFVDVLETNAQAAQLAVDEGLIALHGGATVPPEIPDRYVEDTYVTQTINPQVVAWNTDLVPEGEAPTSLDDLLDPKWDGQIAITDSPDGFVAGLIEARGLDGAREYLEALVGNGLLIRDGHSATVELLAAGEFAISVENYAHHIPRAMEDGAPLAFGTFEPTPANSSGPAIAKCANNPYAAALLAHYYVSAEGAQIVADSGRISIHPDTDLEYDELQPFLEEGTDAYDNLLILNPEISARAIDPAFELINDILEQ